MRLSLSCLFASCCLPVTLIIKELFWQVRKQKEV